MFGFLIALHILVCLLLMSIILMQSGRGGGLTENFASAESMFGVKTNSVLVKGTTIFASLFLVTCLSLAFISSKQNKSLLSGYSDGNRAAPVQAPVGVPIEEPAENLAPEKGSQDQSASTLKAATTSGQAVQKTAVSEIKEATENDNIPTPSAPQAAGDAVPTAQ